MNSRNITLATRLREVFLDGKWIANTNYREQLEGLHWQQAVQSIASLNSVALLTFHINYYLDGLLHVFNGGNLEIKDQYSFDMPIIDTEEAWQRLRDAFFENARLFAIAVENMPDARFDAAFVNENYGSYLRNIEGVIEHSYYHLGQVVLINKMLGHSAGR